MSPFFVFFPLNRFLKASGENLNLSFLLLFNWVTSPRDPCRGKGRGRGGGFAHNRKWILWLAQCVLNITFTPIFASSKERGKKNRERLPEEIFSLFFLPLLKPSESGFAVWWPPEYLRLMKAYSKYQYQCPQTEGRRGLNCWWLRRPRGSRGRRKKKEKKKNCFLVVKKEKTSGGSRLKVHRVDAQKFIFISFQGLWVVLSRFYFPFDLHFVFTASFVQRALHLISLATTFRRF